MLRIISFADPRHLEVAETGEAITSPWDLYVWRDVTDLENGKKQIGDTVHSELIAPGFNHTPVVVEYR